VVIDLKQIVVKLIKNWWTFIAHALRHQVTIRHLNQNPMRFALHATGRELDEILPLAREILEGHVTATPVVNRLLDAAHWAGHRSLRYRSLPECLQLKPSLLFVAGLTIIKHLCEYGGLPAFWNSPKDFSSKW